MYYSMYIATYSPGNSVYLELVEVTVQGNITANILSYFFLIKIFHPSWEHQQYFLTLIPKWLRLFNTTANDSSSLQSHAHDNHVKTQKNQLQEPFSLSFIQGPSPSAKLRHHFTVRRCLHYIALHSLPRLLL